MLTNANSLKAAVARSLLAAGGTENQLAAVFNALDGSRQVLHLNDLVIDDKISSIVAVDDNDFNG